MWEKPLRVNSPDNKLPDTITLKVWRSRTDNSNEDYGKGIVAIPNQVESVILDLRSRVIAENLRMLKYRNTSNSED